VKIRFQHIGIPNAIKIASDGNIEWLAIVLLACRIADILVVPTAGILTYWVRFIGDDGISQLETFVLLFSTMMSLVVFSLSRNYNSDILSSAWVSCIQAVSQWGLIFFIMLAAGFMFKISGEFSRIWIGLWFLFSCTGFVAERLVFARIFYIARRDGRLSVRVAVLGTGPDVSALSDALQDSGDAQVVLTCADDGHASRVGHQRSPGECLQTVVKAIREGGIDCVILVLPWNDVRLHRAIDTLQKLAVEVQVYPQGLDLLMREFPLVRNANATMLGGLPMISVLHRPLGGWNGLIKRVEDLCLLFLMAPFVIPVCLGVALAIKLDSPGPVLFCQKRGGFNGRDFNLFKFRTMRIEDCQSDGITVATARNDPRVTRLGRILRRTSIDELPQLINVLRGDMSVIGPRPHALSHDREFATIIEKYYSRLRVRPGITGWAQINGARGSIEDDGQIRRRVDYDLWYIENWSVMLDVRILLLTAAMGFYSRNAY